MAQPELAVLAQGDLPTGQHWILRAGGTSTDFYTFLETIHPDGRRDQGGMGGPPLYPGRLFNTYTGGSDRGLRRVVVRADPRVARVRVQLASGEGLELPLLATRPDVGLAFFAALLPPDVGLVSVTAVDANGEVLVEPEELSRHEAGWRRLQRESHPPASEV